MLFPIMLLIFAMSSIQYGSALAKGLFPMVGIAGASSLRLVFSSLILCLIFRPWRKKLTRMQWKHLALYGCSLGMMNLSFYFSIDRIPLGLAVALEFTGPLAVAIFSSHKRLHYVWAVIAMTGILLLLPFSSQQASLDLWGIIFALASGFFWAIYIIFGQKAGKEIPGYIAATIGMSFAAVIVFPFGLMLAGKSLLEPSAYPLGLLVAIFASALPYTLEMYGLKKVPARTFGILMSLEPAIATLSGLIFLGEHLTALQWSAILLVMTASLGSSFISDKN